MSAFANNLAAFCEDLRGTFPEQKTAIDRAQQSVTAQTFWKSWHSHIACLAERNTSVLFGTERRGFILGAVRLTPELWAELTETTQTALWRWLRTLLLEAVTETNPEELDVETSAALMSIVMSEKEPAAAAGVAAGIKEHLEPLFERLKGFMGSSGLSDLSGVAFPEIPEHLRRGRIVALAEDIARQFSPEDFGIDPAILTAAGDNVESVLRKLAELYQRDPTKLISGAKNVAEKIKKQVLTGGLNRDEIIAEAKEFIALFKDHPLFKEAIEKFNDMVGGTEGLSALFGGGSNAAPSERRRAVQERLRKKLDARKGNAASSKE